MLSLASESDRGRRFLVDKDLGIGQAAAVIDRDVNVFPADLQAPNALSICAPAGIATLARHAVPGAALDPPELLDVDMD